VTEAERWLRDRVDGAPDELVHAMTAALPPAAASVPEALAEGAMALYAATVRGSGGREDALPLLAADALFTHAFQAQAELDPARLPGLAARYGAAGRLREVAS
jgi:hypothetical protein